MSLQDFVGSFPFSRESIISNAPKKRGLYFCGYINSTGLLVPLYIGRAVGDGVTICIRLLDHLKNDNWRDVTHFGSIIGNSDLEIMVSEAKYIKEYQPKYNKVGK